MGRSGKNNWVTSRPASDAGNRRLSTASHAPNEQRARYHAGALAFERRLVSELGGRKMTVKHLHGLLVFGRDLYRIAMRRSDDSAFDAAARAAAWRVKQGFEKSAVLAVLDHALEALFPPDSGGKPARRMTAGLSGL